VLQREGRFHVAGLAAVVAALEVRATEVERSTHESVCIFGQQGTERGSGLRILLKARGLHGSVWVHGKDAQRSALEVAEVLDAPQVAGGASQVPRRLPLEAEKKFDELRVFATNVLARRLKCRAVVGNGGHNGEWKVATQAEAHELDRVLQVFFCQDAVDDELVAVLQCQLAGMRQKDHGSRHAGRHNPEDSCIHSDRVAVQTHDDPVSERHHVGVVLQTQPIRVDRDRIEADLARHLEHVFELTVQQWFSTRDV